MLARAPCPGNDSYRYYLLLTGLTTTALPLQNQPVDIVIVVVPSEVCMHAGFVRTLAVDVCDPLIHISRERQVAQTLRVSCCCCVSA